MSTSLFSSALTRLILPVALGLAAEPLRFHPGAGTSLTKDFTSEWRLEVDELTISIDGQPWQTGYSLVTTATQDVSVIDTYVAVEAGRPVVLEREFRRASQGIDSVLNGLLGSYDWQSLRGTTELVGATVQFRRNGDEYEPRFDELDEHLDKRLLGGLTEEMDGRFLLPKESALVGDRWELELTSLPDLLSPGGYFAWNVEGWDQAKLLSEQLDPAIMKELRDVAGADLTGYATVEYLAEEDGLCTLGLTIEVEGKKGVDDLSELASRIAAGFPGMGRSWLNQCDLNLALDAKGTATWDSRRGHLVDLQLGGKASGTLDIEMLWGESLKRSVGMSAAIASSFRNRMALRR